MRQPALLLLVGLLVGLLAACGRLSISPPANPTATPAIASPPPPGTPSPLPPSPPPPAATRTGAEYVLRLPRESSVPTGWLMNPPPDFQPRNPQPGATYRFACRDLPARSTGVATVGYRSLEGMPSVHIEYVIYPSAGEAEAALSDMRAAVDACPTFTIGNGATTASLGPLDFPDYGDRSFAAALATENETTGGLVTHLVKVQSSHVVIGVNHSRYAGEEPPDAGLTAALIETALALLAEVPPPVRSEQATGATPVAPDQVRSSRRLSRIM